MRVISSFLLCCIGFTSAFSQIPLYEYRELNKSITVPSNISSQRCAVVVSVPNVDNGFTKIGDWKKLANDAHKAFVTMGLDPIIYINHYDLIAGEKTRTMYSELFSKRRVKNLIFLTQHSSGIDLHIIPFNEKPSFISNKSDAFYMSGSSLYEAMLSTGKEIRRADQEVYNFLVPDKPSFAYGISIIEKTQLQNYPGILRRSTLAVERFAKLPFPEGASEELVRMFDMYNANIDSSNVELEKILRTYPYDYVMIDPTSDDDLKRQRHQFVLRSASGQAKTIREMLDYQVNQSETYFVSVIPVMPDLTKTKTIPKDAIVHKFYIRQNISKNVHVGEWDADESWQEALSNMIGNLIQEHESTKR